MTKNAKSADADREPAPEVQASAEPISRPVPEPPTCAVLLVATNGVRRGAVVRGAASVVAALIAKRAARAATESDIAVCGRVVDL